MRADHRGDNVSALNPGCRIRGYITASGRRPSSTRIFGLNMARVLARGLSNGHGPSHAVANQQFGRRIYSQRNVKKKWQDVQRCARLGHRKGGSPLNGRPIRISLPPPTSATTRSAIKGRVKHNRGTDGQAQFADPPLAPGSPRLSSLLISGVDHRALLIAVPHHREGLLRE